MPCSFTAFFLPFSNFLASRRHKTVCGLDCKTAMHIHPATLRFIKFRFLKENEKFLFFKCLRSRSGRKRHKVRCSINYSRLSGRYFCQRHLQKFYAIIFLWNILRHEIVHSALIFGGIVGMNMLQITFTIFKLKSQTNRHGNMSQREIITSTHSTKLRKKKH